MPFAVMASGIFSYRYRCVMRRKMVFWGAVAVGLAFLFILNVLSGAVDVPLGQTLGVLTGSDAGVDESVRFIILHLRLPQTITALLCGSALAVCGLMLQTVFHNPLADSSLLGISSGAGLGVALVMLFLGGGIMLGALSIEGYVAVLVAAFAGAFAMAFVMYMLSTVIRSSSALLVAGIIFGYVASSAIALLNFFSSDDGIRAFMAWGLGSFGNVSVSRLPIFCSVAVAGLVASVFMVKPLNVLVLGEQYAESLGVRTVALRNRVLVVTGLLTAATTAFCGPVSFIGLAVPHIARMVLRSDDYRVLLPSTMAVGAVVALLCNYFCTSPWGGIVIPVNVVTPLVGAPVVVYVMMKGQRRIR